MWISSKKLHGSPFRGVGNGPCKYSPLRPHFICIQGRDKKALVFYYNKFLAIESKTEEIGRKGVDSIHVALNMVLMNMVMTLRVP
jgi:hypothetical protein